MANIPAGYVVPPFIAAAMAARVGYFQHGDIHQEGPPIEIPLPIDPRDTDKEWTENGGTFIQQLITPKKARVEKWIKDHIPTGPVIIGMSVEHGAETGGDEKADVITLYVPKYCLSYQISRTRICDEMLNLLNKDRCTFVGKKSANGIKDMQMLIRSKLIADHMSVGGGGLVPTLNMANMHECGPAEMYLEGARQLLRRYSTEEVPFNWRARVFTNDQARYTCLNALVGWLFTRGQPPQRP